MIIKEPEALETWLTNKLLPLSDAEPAALAKFILMLLAKNKPLDDLRDFCINNLDIFFKRHPQPFVDELFQVLMSQAYVSKGRTTTFFACILYLN